jgi:hypothetical protein
MEFPNEYPEFINEKWQYAQCPEPKPEPIANPNAYCLKLVKALYGLVQAARQWWKKFKNVMKSIGFLPSDIDPCLFIKDKGNGQKAFVIIYVDDRGIFGTKEDIKETIEALSKSFMVNDLGKLEHFVGCHIIQYLKGKNKIFLYHPKLLKHLEKENKNIIGKPRYFKNQVGP